MSEDNFDLCINNGISSQYSSPSFSDLDIDINKKTPEENSREKNKYASLLSSFDKSSNDEESFRLESSPLGYQTNLSPEENRHERFSRSNLDSFELSFEHIGIPSEEKVAEFKALLDKVNDAYVDWRITEFVLETIKTKSTSWAKQIKAITKASEVQSNIHLKSESGEISNLLGLEEEDVKLSYNRSLALFSKSAFHEHAVELIKANVAKLKLQKKSLQDEFGAHSIKAMVGLMTRERKELLELYRHVENLQNQARQLLSSSQATAQQLATLRCDTDRHLQAATLAMIRNKALYLQTITSVLKEKLEQSLFVDKSMKEKMDAEGDDLKARLAEMRDELKASQKTLTEYKKKEAASDKYKEIVAEYGKVRYQLEHKYQTLKMLNDPNMSL